MSTPSQPELNQVKLSVLELKKKFENASTLNTPCTTRPSSSNSNSNRTAPPPKPIKPKALSSLPITVLETGIESIQIKQTRIKKEIPSNPFEEISNVSHSSSNTSSNNFSNKSDTTNAIPSLQSIPHHPQQSIKTSQRVQIIQEIIESEKKYLSDLHLLYNVYVVPAQRDSILSSQDIKILFSNLNQVIATNSEFLFDLETNALPKDVIGQCFNTNITKLTSTYSEYCKHHEAAMSKTSEFSEKDCPEKIKSFLSKCQLEIQGKTGAWDLGSLVIKPVQRVLKYPLLIKQLLKETQPTHLDYTNLETALDSLEAMADKINEIKKRKDIVDKYVEGKGGLNVMHGITKKFTRTTQQIKMVTGLVGEVSFDELYNKLHERFDAQHKGFLNLEKLTSLWVKSLQEVVEAQECIANLFEESYHVGLDNPTRSRPEELEVIRKYRQSCTSLASMTWKEADITLKSQLKPLFAQYLTLFKHPLLIIKKRDAKRLDYERLIGYKAKGDPIDKALQESADAYESLHAQLLEELPIFISSMQDIMDTLAYRIASMQLASFEAIRKSFLAFGFELTDIIPKHHSVFSIGQPLEVCTRNFTIYNKWKLQVFDCFSSSSDSLQNLVKPLSNDNRDVSNGNVIDMDMDMGMERIKPKELSTSMIGLKATSLDSLSGSPLKNTFTNNSTNNYNMNTTVEIFEAIVIYPFKSNKSNQMSLELGNIIMILDQKDSMWFGEHTKSGRSGWFPCNHVQRRG